MRPAALKRLAFVALGSNLGDSAATLDRAVELLAGFSEQPLLKSSVWKTSPVDCPPGSPPFLNAVIGLEPDAQESPETLLHRLKSIEAGFGRQPKKRINEPRPLDLDLISFRNEIRNTTELKLPHPRAHSRRFVLAPLAEIAPDLVLPGQKQTVAELLRGLTSGELVRRLG